MVVSFGSPFSRLSSKQYHQVKPTCRLSGQLGCLERSEYLELRDCWELSSRCKPSWRSSPDPTSPSSTSPCSCSSSSSSSPSWAWACSEAPSISSKESPEVTTTPSPLHSSPFSRYLQWKTGRVYFSTQWGHLWTLTSLVYSILCGSSWVISSFLISSWPFFLTHFWKKMRRAMKQMKKKKRDLKGSGSSLYRRNTGLIKTKYSWVSRRIWKLITARELTLRKISKTWT